MGILVEEEVYCPIIPEQRVLVSFLAKRAGDRSRRTLCRSILIMGGEVVQEMFSAETGLFATWHWLVNSIPAEEAYDGSMVRQNDRGRL